MPNKQIKLPEYKIDPPVGKGTWGWLFFFLHPVKRDYYSALFVNLIRQTIFRTHPLFLGVLVGLIESGEAKEYPMRLISWISFYAVTLLITILLIFLVYTVLGRAMDKFSKHLSLYGFRHYLSLSESWHENRASGEKLQRLLKSRDSSFSLLEDTAWHLIQFPAVAIAVFVSVYILDANWVYIALFYGMVVSYILVAYKTGEWLRLRYAEFYKTQEDVVGSVYEFLISTSTMRFFNLRKHVMEKAEHFETINHESRRKLFRIAALRWILVDILSVAWIIGIIGYATYDVLYGGLHVSAYATIIFLTITVWYDIEPFAVMYARLLDHWEGFKRLTEVLDQNPDIKDSDDARDVEIASNCPTISFTNVSFGYHTEKSVIQALNLDIKSGEKIGVLGTSGAGKSTLVKLLMRFYDCDNGTLQLYGQDIRTIKQSSVHQHIAVIPQDVALFNHPLIENIRYGRLDASDDEVIEAARKAHAHDFIQALPDGYNTLVGERGVKLSGGQRQRISIARAILKDAPILVLDEATSALDSKSERYIQESLKELMADKTVIAIAHRLSTISHMDRLIVMEEGHIVETGTHDELLRENSVYKKLWSMQSSGFLTEE